MANNRLTLSRPPSGTQAVEVVRQKFSHGRTRSVTVVRRALEPDIHKDKTAHNPRPAPARNKTQRGSEAKQARSKNRIQKRAEALLKQKQERTRRAIEKERVSRKKQQDRQRTTPRPAVDPAKTTEEKLKGRVTELYMMLVGHKAPEFHDQAKAKVQREWLYSVKTKGWGQKHRDRLEFALEVLNAVVAARQPPKIQVPGRGYFYWPSTKVGEPSDTGIDTPEQDEGVLAAKGYHVGLKAPDTPSRRSILTSVYRERLYLNLRAAYLEEWGQPQTAARLQKLANTLASLTRNQKRKQRPSQEAIEQWQADLEFLRTSFYVGRYDFKWPSS